MTRDDDTPDRTHYAGVRGDLGARKPEGEGAIKKSAPFCRVSAVKRRISWEERGQRRAEATASWTHLPQPKAKSLVFLILFKRNVSTDIGNNGESSKAEIPRDSTLPFATPAALNKIVDTERHARDVTAEVDEQNGTRGNEEAVVRNLSALKGRPPDTEKAPIKPLLPPFWPASVSPSVHAARKTRSVNDIGWGTEREMQVGIMVRARRDPIDRLYQFLGLMHTLRQRRARRGDLGGDARDKYQKLNGAWRGICLRGSFSVMCWAEHQTAPNRINELPQEIEELEFAHQDLTASHGPEALIRRGGGFQGRTASSGTADATASDAVVMVNHGDVESTSRSVGLVDRGY
ncbi:hypothetical protein B0H11DRAFT_1898514 [Mycena galericulata]|nr:hypothetical protein B0H11DRAFT_1898514 [Mycena galericulata]